MATKRSQGTLTKAGKTVKKAAKTVAKKVKSAAKPVGRALGIKTKPASKSKSGTRKSSKSKASSR